MNWDILQIKNTNNVYIASYVCSKTVGENGYGQITGDIKIDLGSLKYDELTKEQAINLVKTSIKTNMDGSVKESNIKNIEDTVTRLANESVANNKKVPWE